MTERPILMGTAAVHGIIGETVPLKTQTRRPILPQPYIETEYGDYGSVLGHSFVWDHAAFNAAYEAGAEPLLLTDFCPFGRPGDHLWVRETWAPESVLRDGDHARTIYKADHETDLIYGRVLFAGHRWYPSIHMPRARCRIVLEIEAVRVQHLREVTEADAQAEGFADLATFLSAWDRLYRKTPNLIKRNTWVWAITFRRFEAEAHGGR